MVEDVGIASCRDFPESRCPRPLPPASRGNKFQRWNMFIPNGPLFALIFLLRSYDAEACMRDPTLHDTWTPLDESHGHGSNKKKSLRGLSSSSPVVEDSCGRRRSVAKGWAPLKLI